MRLPHLVGNYLCFTDKKRLTFIGYPLTSAEDNPAEDYEAACARFKPDTVSIVASEIWLQEGTYIGDVPDQYYRLILPIKHVHPEVAYMLRRAERELRVTEGAFGRKHKKIIKAFLSTHDLSEGQRQIFKNIPRYFNTSQNVRLLEAWHGKNLAAFNILDMSSARYAFYLFNFRSTKVNVPGASDLLFHDMAALAHKEGKEVINLGLGINKGIRRFKEKWGGKPFLAHVSAIVQRKQPEMGFLMKKL